MALVIKTLSDVLPLSKEAIERLEKLKDSPIDFSDMPELIDEQIPRMTKRRERRAINNFQ